MVYLKKVWPYKLRQSISIFLHVPSNINQYCFVALLKVLFIKLVEREVLYEVYTFIYLVSYTLL